MPAQRGKWLTVAVDWPNEELGRPGADGAEQDWVQDDFHHAGFVAVQWEWPKAEGGAYVDAGWH